MLMRAPKERSPAVFSVYRTAPLETTTSLEYGSVLQVSFPPLLYARLGVMRAVGCRCLAGD